MLSPCLTEKKRRTMSPPLEVAASNATICQGMDDD